MTKPRRQPLALGADDFELSATPLYQNFVDGTPMFRVTKPIPLLPNNGTIPVDMEAGASALPVQIYGVAINALDSTRIPLPYASLALNGNIQLSWADGVISVTTAIDYSTYVGFLTAIYAA